MLTPIEIQGRSFKSGLGYEKKDVEGFVKELSSDYEILYKENGELKDKINVLSDGIQYYKTIEKTLQKALVLAERASDETQSAAQKKAENIEQEALTKANMIVADAKRQLDEMHLKTVNLMQQYEIYKGQFRQLAAAQLEILETDSFQLQVANLDTLLKETSESKPEEPTIKMTTTNSVIEKKSTADMQEMFPEELSFEFTDME